MPPVIRHRLPIGPIPPSRGLRHARPAGFVSVFASAFAIATCAALIAVQAHAPAHAAAPDFIPFESGHVRPLALSADGTKLFAVNTPNNTLEVFNVTASGLQLAARVPVGLEPVSVAVRNASEVWVVNHLSDSVSVVSLQGTPRVVRTLLVGDEPRDIVFAGTPAAATTASKS